MKIGLPGLLTIIFVLLKAFEVIDWSWWWVFSPLWIAAIVWIIIMIVVVVAGVLSEK